jgi:mannosyltransferase
MNPEYQSEKNRAATMKPSETGDSARWSKTELLLLAALFALAAALRFWRLADWGLDSDEVFTLRDSVTIRPTNPRPLGYLLNHYLIRPFLPLNEFGLRLLPAFFGALAIPALYLATRRMIGRRAAFLAALLLTFSPLHVIYSQFGRYWALVFLLTAIYPYALYRGIRERNTGLIILGVLAGILASLAHPVSVLLVGGPALWFLVTNLRPQRLRSLWSHQGVRWGIGITAVVLVMIAIRFVPILQNWISEHDANPGSGQFLLAPNLPPGLKQAKYLLTYVEAWTFQLVLASLLGIAVLWQGRDRFFARFLVSLALFPAIFLLIVQLRTPISTYYLIPIAPVFFMGAGVFLDHVFGLQWRLRPAWLPAAAVTAMIVAAGAPTLVSQYRNGRRFDFKGVAGWLEPRLTSSDVVFSDQPVALAHYLPETQVERLRHDTDPLTESLRALRSSEGGGTLWVVAPAPAHAFRTNLRQGGLADWLYGNCQLRNVVGVGRMDFRQQYLQIYQCPPAAATRSTDKPTRDQGDKVAASAKPLRDSTSR